MCENCGFLYQLSDLRWQYEWAGSRLVNQRQLVCETCNDAPQEQLRTVVLPPDPDSLFNVRPANYVQDDNPLSVTGVSANFSQPSYGSRIGNLTGAGGINAPFDGNPVKPVRLSATNVGVSNSSYNNYIGINWQGNVNNMGMPTDLLPPVIRHSLTSFTVYAPTDATFLRGTTTNWVVQASDVATTLFSAWTTVSSGTTTGVAGESFTVTVTSTFTNPTSQFHRVAFQGNGVQYISVAEVEFSVAELGGDGET